MGRDQLVEKLNSPSKRKRLRALKKLARLDRRAADDRPEREDEINLHLRTFFSYSPYSPSQAAYYAYRSGAGGAGLLDHDTLSGAKEFARACALLGVPHEEGFDFRVRLGKESCGELRPGGDTYVAVYGAPPSRFRALDEWLAEEREERVARNRKFARAVNAFFAPSGISVDFSADVLPLARAKEGGSVTSRHVLRAAAEKIEAKFGRGEAVTAFLAERGLHADGTLALRLADPDDPYYTDDLVAVLKDNAAAFGTAGRRRTPDMRGIVERLENLGAIVSYMFYGDLDGAVEGATEEEKLARLVRGVSELGFHSISVKISEVGKETLAALGALCAEHSLFLIPASPVNAPRQSFPCELPGEGEFSALAEAAWAVLGHAATVARSPEEGMFSARAVARCPDLEKRVRLYAVIGREGAGK